MLSKLSSRVTSINLPYLSETLLWVINLQSIQSEELIEAYALLNQEYIERIERNKSEIEKSKTLVSHAILRMILGGVTGQEPRKMEILQGMHNKPYIRDYPIHFNLSHTAQFGLLACHPNRALGVDIEEVQRDLDWKGMSEIFMSSKEMTLMSYHCNPIEYFFEVWCAKEAYLKAIGIGFSVHQIPQFDSTMELEAGIKKLTLEETSVVVYHNQVLGHVLAVCQL